MKKTKVVCTVGPSTDKAGTLEAMIAAGMNVARFNFSHGTHADHAARIAMVREAAAKVGKPVALMLDTKGPEMRLGLFEKGKVLLKEGQKFILTSRILPGTEEMASVNYEALPREISSGNVILLADGLISLRVEAIEQDNIITTVLNNGEISDRKRVAVPGVALNLPPLSEQDVA
ncbi:MAG: pyk, partial [Firmicutes bacterium]|nr:pyk [Bacillota bacterium]